MADEENKKKEKPMTFASKQTSTICKAEAPSQTGSGSLECTFEHNLLLVAFLCRT